MDERESSMPMREWDEMWCGDEMWWDGRTFVWDGLKLDELILLLKYWYMHHRKPIAKYFRIARSLFLFSTKAHRCWPWPPHIWWCADFLTCSISEIRRIRWSRSYAQVWLKMESTPAVFLCQLWWLSWRRSLHLLTPYNSDEDVWVSVRLRCNRCVNKCCKTL
jgi:hypothetical protein